MGENLALLALYSQKPRIIGKKYSAKISAFSVPKC